MIVPAAISSVWWHATRCPGVTSRSSGRSVVHRPGWTHGQRVENRQPVGGSAGLGRSPVSRIRSRVASTTGSGTGMADISASVYGCIGWS